MSETGLLCLCGKALVAGGCRGDFCEMLGVVLLDTEPMSASSKTDPPLAKADPISNTVGTSVVIYLRNGKIHCTGAVRGLRICERQNPADTDVSEEGEEEVLQAPEQRFPCSS